MFGLHSPGIKSRESLLDSSEWSVLVRLAKGLVAALLLYAIIPANVFGQNWQEPPPPPAPFPQKQFPAAKQKRPPAEAGDEAATGVKSAAGSPLTNGEKDSPEAIRKRQEWFYKQRSSVNGHIPAGARLKALQHMQRMMEAEGKPVRRADGSYTAAGQQSGGTAWTPVGPTPTTGGTFSPVTGRITTIAVDPSDSTGNTLLLGGAQGGIWRSTDAGASWTAVGDQNPSLAMGSIAFAPSSPGTVYAGTGEQAAFGFDIYYGAGVLKSTDHGQTWTQTCTTPGPSCPFIGPYLDVNGGYYTFGGARISYVAVNPTNPTLVLVAAQFLLEGPQEGVYCSQDGGATWTNVLPDEMATFVGFASPSVAYAALGNVLGSSPGAPNGNGIYKATGIGSTCSSIKFMLVGGSGLPSQASMGRIDLGIAPSDSNTVYASISDASNVSSKNLGVYVTTNGGANWLQTGAPDVCQDQCWYDNVVKVDPTNKQDAFFGGAAVVTTSGNSPSWVVRTQNGGTNWSSVIPNSSSGDPGVPHVDSHAMAFVKLPGGKMRLYLGNDGGIWRTDDAEAATITWTNLNNPSLTLTQFYPSISIHPSSSQVAFGGTQDNGSQDYQSGTSWVDNRLCGDGTATAIDTQIPSTVYVTCPNFGGGFPVFASYQGGALGTFFLANNGINPNDTSNFVAPLVVDPNNPDTVYFAGTSVYQSLDAGNTWAVIRGPLVIGSGESLTAMAVSPRNPAFAFVGSSAGNVFYSNSLLTPGQGFVPEYSVSAVLRRGVTAVAFDPSDSTASTVYVSLSGFSFVGSDALGNYIDDPGGHIFKTTVGGTTAVDVSCSVANCSAPAATDLPNIPVNDLLLDPDVPGILYAATDLGVYVGNCSATPCTWSTLGTSLPNVAVLSLRLHEASRTLRAATHGRGVWDLALNNFAFTGPRIFSLSPVSTSAAGGSAVTLTVNGTGLTGGTVQWNGGTTGVTTQTGGTDTTLTATIDPSLLVAGSVSVTVNTASATSNAVPFDVTALTPTLSSLSPAGTPVQTAFPMASVQVQLTGTNFANGARVLFNGAQNGISTTFNSGSSLTATLPGRLLGPIGSTNDISVINTPPGGGKSQPQTFRIIAPPPPNDNIANATVISAPFYGNIVDSSGATTESTDPVPPCAQQITAAQGNTGGHANGQYNTIWYAFTPQFSANLEVDTIGSSYDTVLSIWSGAPGSLTNVACNDDINPGVVLQSQISSAALTAGTTYYIMVSSFGPPDPNPLALGGESILDFRYNGGLNPTPTLTSLLPTSVGSGGPGFTLTVNGSLFLNGASVYFANQQVNTAYVSSTQLTAMIPTSAIVLPGTYSVFVANPPPSDTSTNVNFDVTVGTYPVPILSSVAPTNIAVGSLPFTLYATGADFASNATLNMNGVPLQTTVNDPGHLSAIGQGASISTAGTALVTVVNPSPGGGPSASLPVNITTPTLVPTITSVTPSTFPGGVVNLQMTVNGTNFQSGACLFFNGFCLYGANVVNSTQMTAFISESLAVGTYPVYVQDPYPAGTSGPFNITVTAPPDFTLMPTVSSVTVNAGQPAIFPISIAATGGFTGNVSLSCGGPATGTTCSASPNPVAAGTTSTVTVTTTARGLLPPDERPPWVHWPAALPVVVLVLVCSLLALRGVTSGRQRRWSYSLPLIFLVLYFVFQSAGCGGSGGGSTFGGGGGGGNPNGTPPGNYAVIVTATSGALQHQITVTVKVN